jgi:lipid A 4'-phosphatase
VLSLVLFINLILKNFWGRARPNEIYDLGGDNYFTPWYQISKQCITNCSFVSGDAGVGFTLIIFFFLIKKEIYLWLAFILGLVLGLVRILEGAHFFSDIILSCLIVFVLNLVFYTYYMKKINV